MRQTPKLQSIQELMEPGGVLSRDGFLGGEDTRNLADILLEDQKWWPASV